MINKNVYFLEENASYDMLVERSLEFGAYLNDNKIKEIKIYLSSAFDFCAALFGAMMAKAKAHILADENNSNINDLNFKQLKGKSNDEFVLDVEYRFYLYTSGSTQKPKIIEKSLQDMFCEASFLRDFIKLHNDKIDKVCASVSHQHMFGLTFKIFVALASGFKISSIRLSIPELVESYDFNNAIFISSPTFLEALIEYKIFSKTSAAPPHLIITAGSKFNEILRKSFKCQILEIYGSTETGVIASNVGDGFKIFEAVNANLDSSARLRVDSKWCKDFLTPDICNLSGENLTLLGRFDRIVKLNETNFNLDEAEAEILKSPLIKEAKCALLSGDTRIKALLVLSKNGEMEFRDNGKLGIIKSLKSILPPKCRTNIRHFKIVANLLRNENGKFGLKNFKELYEMKVKPCFSLITKDDNNYDFSALINIDCFFFAGHFREFPLTPGFMQIDFVFECLKMQNINTQGKYIIENLKFVAFLRPLDMCRIKICIQEKMINFHIFANETLCTQGRIRFV